MVNPNLEDLIQEFNSYSWDSRKQEVGEDKPIKEHDHGMDALRYMINGIPKIRKRMIHN
jgi:phage terminase large subunit